MLFSSPFWCLGTSSFQSSDHATVRDVRWLRVLEPGESEQRQVDFLTSPQWHSFCPWWVLGSLELCIFELRYYEKLCLGSSQECNYSGKKLWIHGHFWILDGAAAQNCFILSVQQDFYTSFPFANLVVLWGCWDTLGCVRVSLLSLLQAQGHLLRLSIFLYHPSTCTQRAGRGVVWHALEP